MVYLPESLSPRPPSKRDFGLFQRKQTPNGIQVVLTNFIKKTAEFCISYTVSMSMSMFGVDHGGVCICFTVSFRMSMSMFGVDVRGGVCEVLVFCLHQEMLRRHQGLVLDH